MQTVCERCVGKGLIGGGPNPHMLEGRIETCPDCGGTGKVGEKDSVEEKSAPSVDNQPAPVAGGGILKWLFGKK